MREIKFRIWDVTPVEDGYVGLMIDMNYATQSRYLIDALNGKYPIMQYTGLKDKNGKEIYEGDIVDCNDQYRSVKWSDQNAQFYMAHSKGTVNFRMEFMYCGQSQSDGPVHCDTCEIIGNIYEHPHLLTNKLNKTLSGDKK